MSKNYYDNLTETFVMCILATCAFFQMTSLVREESG